MQLPPRQSYLVTGVLGLLTLNSPFLIENIKNYCLSKCPGAFCPIFHGNFKDGPWNFSFSFLPSCLFMLTGGRNFAESLIPASIRSKCTERCATLHCGHLAKNYIQHKPKQHLKWQPIILPWRGSVNISKASLSCFSPVSCPLGFGSLNQYNLFLASFSPDSLRLDLLPSWPLDSALKPGCSSETQLFLSHSWNLPTDPA